MPKENLAFCYYPYTAPQEASSFHIPLHLAFTVLLTKQALRSPIPLSGKLISQAHTLFYLLGLVLFVSNSEGLLVGGGVEHSTGGQH